jgi:hypothetical protein
MREVTMMHPAMPKAMRHEQIVLYIRFSVQNLIQGLIYGQRVIQNPERIHVAPEFILLQQISDILGKTRAKEHQSVRMTDFCLPFRQFHLRSEIHFYS